MKLIFHPCPALPTSHQAPPMLPMVPASPALPTSRTSPTPAKPTRAASSTIQRRHVHFDESLNQIHPHLHPQAYSQECAAAPWYSRNEIRSFREQTVQQAQLILKGESLVSVESTPESDALSKAYQGFCSVQTSSDMLQLLTDTKHNSLHYSLVGIDPWIVRGLQDDKTQRRQRILRQIHWIQKTYRHDDVALRDEKIRQISRSISQPSRLYAYHVARLSMRGGESSASAQ